jgi:hypothetical protein
MIGVNCSGCLVSESVMDGIAMAPLLAEWLAGVRVH